MKSQRLYCLSLVYYKQEVENIIPSIEVLHPNLQETP